MRLGEGINSSYSSREQGFKVLSDSGNIYITSGDIVDRSGMVHYIDQLELFVVVTECIDRTCDPKSV
jgi:hypothetical protein